MATTKTKKKPNQNYSAKLADGRRVTVKNGVKTYTPAPTTKKAPASSGGGNKPLTSAQQTQLANIKSQALQIQDKINVLKQKEASTGTSITADSTSAVNAETNLGNNITDLYNRFGLDSAGDDGTDRLYKLQKEQDREIQRQRDALEARRAGEVEGIEEGFGVAKTDTEFAQSREVGQTSTDLAAAGGYLGVTASQQGVLQNLTLVHRQEMVALEAQKNEAIRAANNAYEDRDFELAREKLKAARDLEQQVYTRQQDFFNRQLDLAGEQRAQLQEQRLSKEFKNKMATQRIDLLLEGGIKPSATDIYKIAQEIGYSTDEVERIFEAGAATRDLENSATRTNRDVGIVNALRGVPRDKIVTIDGKQYQGLGELATSGSSGTATERETARQEMFKAMLMEDLRGGTDAQGNKVEPITFDEALKTYPELSTKTVEEIYNALETYEDKAELDSKLASGEWDVVVPVNKEGNAQKAIIYDKKAYEEAVKKWSQDSTTGWFAGSVQGDDDLKAVAVVDGVEYVGVGRWSETEKRYVPNVLIEDFRITQ